VVAKPLYLGATLLIFLTYSFPWTDYFDFRYWQYAKNTFPEVTELQKFSCKPNNQLTWRYRHKCSVDGWQSLWVQTRDNCQSYCDIIALRQHKISCVELLPCFINFRFAGHLILGRSCLPIFWMSRFIWVNRYIQRPKNSGWIVQSNPTGST